MYVKLAIGFLLVWVFWPLLVAFKDFWSSWRKDALLLLLVVGSAIREARRIHNFFWGP